MGAFSLIVVINLLNRSKCVLNMVQNELAHTTSKSKAAQAEIDLSVVDPRSVHVIGSIKSRELTSASSSAESRSQRCSPLDESFASETAPTRFRVGYWFPEKSIRLINWGEFAELCKCHGIDLIELDLKSDVDQQLPLDLIFHKIISLYKPKLRGMNSNVEFNFKRLLNFIESHPEIPAIDPVPAQLQLFNREYVCNLISSVCSEINIQTPRTNVNNPDPDTFNGSQSNCCKVQIPLWYKLSQAPMSQAELPRMQGLQLPCICKCVDTWEERSHEMSIVFSWKQLIQSSAERLRYPIILQNFVRHQKVLFKVYVIGKQTIVQKRPSVDIPEIYSEETEPMHFNGHKISKTEQNHSVKKHTARDASCHGNGSDVSVSFDMETVLKVVNNIREKIKLDIFGLDFLVAANEEHTTATQGAMSQNTHYIIDVNPFPGCSSLTNLHELFLNLLMSKLTK